MGVAGGGVTQEKKLCMGVAGEGETQKKTPMPMGATVQLAVGDSGKEVAQEKLERPLGKGPSS